MARMRAPERREQLLEVAARLFAERGYRGTTTADLAAAAGVTEPILYRHFESKRDLFVTLVDEVGREVIARWRDALGAVADPASRLRVLLDANPATHARGRGVYRVIFHAMSAPAEEREIAAGIQRHLTKLQAFLRGEIAALQKAGVVRRDEPAALLAWLLMHVAIGYGMVAPLGLPRGPGAAGRKDMQRVLEEMLVA